MADDLIHLRLTEEPDVFTVREAGRQVATVLSGELTLDSTLGEGTTVTVRLPTHRPLAGLGLRHVLVIDADAASRRGLRDLVEGAAGRVSEGPGRADATVSRDHPDPVMLAETVRHIREGKGRR